MPITFSVVTVTFNSEKYIEEAIESVVLQRGFFFIDYVVIDNCSTDKTKKILERYRIGIQDGSIKCNCHGVKFRYLSEHDNGMYDALVKGMRMCDGDYFSYINSDDFYLPNAFTTISKCFQDPEVKWVTGMPCIYNEDGGIVDATSSCVFNSSYIRSGVYGTYMPHIQQESTFWRHELLDELDYDALANFNFAGDFYMWSTFAKKHSLYTVRSIISGFRMHSENKSSDISSYNEEFHSIAVNRLSVVDYLRIFIYKALFKVFGNKLLNYFCNIIDLR